MVNTDPTPVIVLNEGVIGIAAIEGESINNYLREEVSKTGEFRGITAEELNLANYNGCLDETCLSELIQRVDAEYIMQWSLEKNGNKYRGKFTLYRYPESNGYKQFTMRSKSLKATTDNVDEMIMLMRMKSWEVLGLKPPMDRFGDVASKESKIPWLYVASASLGLALVLSLLGGSGAKGPEPFETPPDWPAL